MKEVHITLNIHQLNSVMIGLEIQKDLVSGCIQAIQAQVQPQLALVQEDKPQEKKIKDSEESELAG